VRDLQTFFFVHKEFSICNGQKILEMLKMYCDAHKTQDFQSLFLSFSRASKSLIIVSRGYSENILHVKSFEM